MNLSKKQRNDCKVIFTLTVVSLLLDRITKQTQSKFTTEQNPAVSQCIAEIDSRFEQYNPEQDAQIIRAYHEHINSNRRRFMGKVSKVQAESGLVGALRVLTKVKARPGTRLAFIIDQFRTNLENIEKAFLKNEKEVRYFETQFKNAIGRV